MELRGTPYPIVKHPRGLLHSQKGIDTVKSDLLALLLTSPGERVMLPTYGTPLKKLLFEPSDTDVVNQAKEMIQDSIRMWEPRVVIQSLEVSTTVDPEEMEGSLNVEDTRDQVGHILLITIKFSDFENIAEINELVLQVPLGG
jgi:phage baseplate assembly protein W